MSNLNPARTVTLIAGAIGGATASFLLNSIAVVPILLVTPLMGLAAARGIKENGAAAIANEMIELSAALVFSSEEPAGALRQIVLPGYDPESRAQVSDPTTLGVWTRTAALSSKIIVGAKGSGKSSLAKLFAGEIAASGARLQISDRHYPSTDWLPGVSAEDFESSFLVKDAGGTLGALTALATKLTNRIANGDVDSKPHHLLIDEWGGCWSQWNPSDRRAAIGALTRISEEGRKYGVACSLILHTMTKESTGIDQALASAGDLYLCGDSLSNTSWPFPSSLSFQREGLTAARLALVSDRAIAPQRVIVRRDAFGAAAVVVAPDLSQPERFEAVRPAGDDLAERMERAYEPGMSARKLSAAIGVTNRKKSNPDYAAVADYIAGKSAPASERQGFQPAATPASSGDAPALGGDAPAFDTEKTHQVAT